MNKRQAKVNFLICGVQKAGTTAIYEYLKQVNEVCVADPKELHFFDHDPYFNPINEGDIMHPGLYDWYESRFNIEEHHKAVGEVTPIYYWWENSMYRIKKYNPYMKVIVILRDPIERAYAHWNMENGRSADVMSFSQAIRFEQSNVFPQHRVLSYIARGMYYHLVKDILQMFSDPLIIPYSTFSRKGDGPVHEEGRQVRRLHDILKYIGVEDLNKSHIDFTARHFETDYKHGPMKASDRHYLENVFKHDTKMVLNLLNWDSF